jgi:hypothetical protein
MVCSENRLTHLSIVKSSIPISAFLLVALAGSAVADMPKKAPSTKYSGLWTNSPFTSKPPPAEAGPENNPLDDYVLLGVSSIGNKSYRVTMINKKKPDEPRIYVETNGESKGFKLLGVTRKEGDPLGTVVRMQSGPMTGTVKYDQKLLTLAPPPAAAKANAQGGQNVQPGQGANVQPGQQPPVPGANPQAQGRQPRPRVVPPPSPTTGGGQPGQVQQGQPNQGQQNNRGDRPQRRGNN